MWRRTLVGCVLSILAWWAMGRVNLYGLQNAWAQYCTIFDSDLRLNTMTAEIPREYGPLVFKPTLTKPGKQSIVVSARCTGLHFIPLFCCLAMGWGIPIAVQVNATRLAAMILLNRVGVSHFWAHDAAGVAIVLLSAAAVILIEDRLKCCRQTH